MKERKTNFYLHLIHKDRSVMQHAKCELNEFIDFFKF